MSNVQEDLKTLLEKPVLIYGAGRGAFRLILDLRALNSNIIGLAVSDISDKRTLGFEGYQVKTPESYISYMDTAVVLIATSEKYQDEIKENCLRLGFKKIITRSIELMEYVSDISHKKLFEKHNLPFDKEIITIGKGKYLNPYSDIFSNKFGIVDQWEDICSTAFGDMSMSFEGPYEYGEVQISEGDIALDIGANIGYVSAYASSKGAEVYAFEPNPANYPLIKRHNELNGNKIHLEPLAVSDKCGTAEFCISLDADAGSSLDADIVGAKNSSVIKVEQLTIDEFVKRKELEKVDYIHANILGLEPLMLKGAQETLRKFSPKLAICTYLRLDEEPVMIDLIKNANPAYKITHKCGKLYANT